MGVEDRDWYREEPPADERRLRRFALPLVLLAVLVLVVVSRYPHSAASNNPEHVVHHDMSIEVAGLTISLGQAPLYASNDPWKSYLADEQTCPNAEDVSAPVGEQALTMIRVLNSDSTG